MKKLIILSFSCLFPVLCAVTVLAQNAAKPVMTAEDKAATTKVAQLLEASGQTYGKVNEGVWAVKFKGTQTEEIAVATIYSQGMLIFVTEVAEKKEFKSTPELLQKLLALNDTMDRVKVGINSKDGGIFLRIDLTLRIVDQQEFNANLEQIAAAADETFGIIKPFLIVPKKTVK